MDKNQLAKELIKTLEEEKGVPVQLTVDTPESVRYATGYGEREYFGSFSKRPVTVRRVQNLDQKYEHDVALLEGSYKSLSELVRKIEEYDVLWGYKDTAKKAWELVEKTLLKKTMLVKDESGKVVDHHTVTMLGDQFFCQPLASNFYVEGFREKVCKILDENGITYIQHRIRARPDGLFDDRTGGGTLVTVDETKVADIILELFK